MTSHESAKINEKMIPRIASDFQCFVCGGIFTTDGDREQHLAMESRGMLLASSQEERDMAALQDAMNKGRKHHL